MTKDTERALEIIRPMAEEIGINVSADDSFLYCNGQAIGIGCNSAYATINEFIGYAMINLCEREYRFKDTMASAMNRAIRRYWFSDEQLKKIFRKAKVNEKTDPESAARRQVQN